MNLNDPMKYFKLISNIPRCSGQEDKIIDFLADFATRNKLEYIIEPDSKNIIIKKPGSNGKLNSPTVILQGHMDMVCEKNENIIHDFNKDPLKLIEQDGNIYASGTTLGADNGVAIAYGLAILESKTISHPPLEVLFTTEEETTMKGAELLHAKNLKGTLLFNLDGGDENTFVVSSAGGIDYIQTIPIEFERSHFSQGVKILISGLYGGHSGADINKGLGNSIKIMTELLFQIQEFIPFHLVNIQGGSKINAIPREASCEIIIEPSEIKKFQEIVFKYQESYKKRQHPNDNLMVDLTSIESSGLWIGNHVQKILLDTLLIQPNGVLEMSNEIPDFVIASQNIAIIETTKDQVIVSTSIRSSNAYLKDLAIKKMDVISQLGGFQSKTHSDYPEWAYKKDSSLRTLAENVFEKKFEKKPSVQAIHAGLECGFFAEKLKNNPIDILSFGPNIFGLHSPDEHMEIASFQRVYDFLVQLLESIE